MLYPRLLSGVLGLSLIVASLAQAQSYTSKFDFRISGIRAGDITISGEQSGKNYTAKAKVKSAGFVGAFADFYFDGTSKGQISSAGTLIPVAFVARSKSPRTARTTKIDSKGGIPVSVLVDPPRGSAPDPKSQAGTLDPVAASFALLRDAPASQVCNKTVDVFDGSRRSRISLASPQVSKDKLICTGTYSRLEGEEDTFSASKSYNFKVIFRDVGGMAQLYQIETKTKFGKATLKRK